MRRNLLRGIALCVALSFTPAWMAAQNAPEPQNDSEKLALLYMNTVLNAQSQYKKKFAKYAPSLAALVGKGSFTKRMARTDRGDYTVRYHSTGESFRLTMAPKFPAPERRGFTVDGTGKIRVVAEEVAADAGS
jgi:hypothetical protein